MLKYEQIAFLLELLREKYGPGYSDEEIETPHGIISIGSLQAMLSIMAEVAHNKEVENDKG